MEDGLTLAQSESSDSSHARAWMRAVQLGFHEPDLDEEVIRRLETFLDMPGFVATTVFRKSAAKFSGAMDVSVGTFARFLAPVNLGAAEVTAGLPTEVDVLPTHKRRGLLWTMMALDVEQLVDEGCPLLLLMASDAQIYERFGFERVVGTFLVSFDPRGLQMRESVKQSLQGYNIGWVDRESVVDVTTEIYARVHAMTRGSIARWDSYLPHHYFPGSLEGVDRKQRCFICSDPSGTPTGFVFYEVKSESDRFVLSILDMAYTDGSTELALWQHLLSIEMIDEVTYSQFTASGPGGGSPLFRAVTDSRAIKVLGRTDFLWAKVLDPIACLEARSYSTSASAAWMSAQFRVEDPDGYASGFYRLELGEGRARVQRLDDREDYLGVTVTANALAALVFASASVTELAEVGLIQGLPRSEWETWDALFTPVGPARTSTQF